MINRLHGGNVWQYLESSRRAIVDFSVNINPLGISDKIKNSIARSINEITYYPDPESKYLKKSLAGYHGLSPCNFLAGNGSNELIHLIPRALKAKTVLIPVPTFSEYEYAARANNANCLFVKSAEKDNFKIDISGLIRLIPKADIVFLCNPNNPSGFALSRKEILSLLKACKRSNAMLVVDEAFVDFAASKDDIAMDEESAGSKNLLVLRSLTKLFVLPGLRMGYAVGHKETIERLSRHIYPWNVNTLAQIISAEVVEDEGYIRHTKKLVMKEKAYLYCNLNKTRGIKAYPSDANFFLCSLNDSKIKSAAALTKKLMRQKILIRNCDNFRGLDERFFRIAVKKREDNEKLVSALKGVLE